MDKKYRRRRSIFLGYAFFYFVYAIFITLSLSDAQESKWYSAIYTISNYLNIVWVYALIHLKEFIIGVHWKEEFPSVLKLFWWLAFLFGLVYWATVIHNYFSGLL
ncbi:hypothetical protein [Priestia aryabhattai]